MPCTQPRAALSTLALLALCFHEALALPCPLGEVELARALHPGRALLSAEPEPEPQFTLDGAEPIPYPWGDPEAITTPEMDAFRFEEEIDAVLNAPLSDWVILPEVRAPLLPVRALLY